MCAEIDLKIEIVQILIKYSLRTELFQRENLCQFLSILESSEEIIQEQSRVIKKQRTVIENQKAQIQQLEEEILRNSESWHHFQDKVRC